MLSMRSVTVCFLALAAAAQAQVRTQPLCFRGRPLPACESFLLFELGGIGQFAATGGIPVAGQSNAKDPNGFVSLDVGAMTNRPDRTAIGGSLELGIGQRHLRRIAVEVRRRQWLSDRIALELGTGPLEVNGRETFALLEPGAAYGATVHGGLVLMNLATLTMTVDVVQGRRTQLALSAGGRLGSYATIATALVGAGLGALVGAALRD